MNSFQKPGSALLPLALPAQAACLRRWLLIGCCGPGSLGLLPAGKWASGHSLVHKYVLYMVWLLPASDTEALSVLLGQATSAACSGIRNPGPGGCAGCSRIAASGAKSCPSVGPAPARAWGQAWGPAHGRA